MAKKVFLKIRETITNKSGKLNGRNGLHVPDGGGTRLGQAWDKRGTILAAIKAEVVWNE
jgi:hypothetical protein